jgi:uncharacterized protein YcbX
MHQEAPIPFAADVYGQISELWVYPVKSLAGISLAQSRLLETGLEWDRHWMVVDAQGLFLSQRELPRMALVQPALGERSMTLQAPGHRSMEVSFQTSGSPLEVSVWDDTVLALDAGDAVATWLQQVLDSPGARLVSFAPGVQRPCSTRWTSGALSHTQFADGYPVLVTTDSSLAPLNQRLGEAGLPPVDMRRFRPNVVLKGLDAHDEDHIAVLQFDASDPAADSARLALVKPCARCPIPNIDPQTAQSHPGVGDVLQAYRRDARVNGAITFGMNAIVQTGAGQMLQVGQSVAASYRFEA